MLLKLFDLLPGAGNRTAVFAAAAAVVAYLQEQNVAVPHWVLVALGALTIIYARLGMEPKPTTTETPKP